MTDAHKWQLAALTLGIGLLLWLLGPVLTPFVVAALLAYLGDPLVDRLDRLGLSRTGSVARRHIRRSRDTDSRGDGAAGAAGSAVPGRSRSRSRSARLTRTAAFTSGSTPV